MIIDDNSDETPDPDELADGVCSETDGSSPCVGRTRARALPGNRFTRIRSQPSRWSGINFALFVFPCGDLISPVWPIRD